MPVAVSFVSRTQPLPLVAAQFQTGFAEPRPEEAKSTLRVSIPERNGSVSRLIRIRRKVQNVKYMKTQG